MRWLAGVLLVVACGGRSSTETTFAALPESGPAPAVSIDEGFATERLTGDVLVAGLYALYPTAEAVRAGSADRSVVHAVRVLADQGDAILVETAAHDDCVEGFGDGYEVKAYVARTALVPRLAAPVARGFADGTAIAL